MNETAFSFIARLLSLVDVGMFEQLFYIDY